MASVAGLSPAWAAGISSASVSPPDFFSGVRFRQKLHHLRCGLEVVAEAFCRSASSSTARRCARSEATCSELGDSSSVTSEATGSIETASATASATGKSDAATSPEHYIRFSGFCGRNFCSGRFPSSYRFFNRASFLTDDRFHGQICYRGNFQIVFCLGGSLFWRSLRCRCVLGATTSSLATDSSAVVSPSEAIGVSARFSACGDSESPPVSTAGSSGNLARNRKFDARIGDGVKI